MSWSKVKYFFFDTPEEKEAAQYGYEKEQTDMKKQQDPPEQQDVTFPKAQPKQNVVSIETAKQSSKSCFIRTTHIFGSTRDCGPLKR